MKTPLIITGIIVLLIIIILIVQKFRLEKCTTLTKEALQVNQVNSCSEEPVETAKYTTILIKKFPFKSKVQQEKETGYVTTIAV